MGFRAIWVVSTVFYFIVAKHKTSEQRRRLKRLFTDIYNLVEKPNSIIIFGRIPVQSRPTSKIAKTPVRPGRAVIYGEIR